MNLLRIARYIMGHNEVVMKKIFFPVRGTVLFIIIAMFGCASGPQLGEPSLLQQELNKLPEVPVAGKN